MIPVRSANESDLAVEDLAERARDDAARLERAGELAEVPVELRDAREHVVEAAGGALAVAVEDERVDLVAQERDLRAEGEDVLDRAVVEVEADPHEALLARADEHLLALRGALEQELALEDRRERGAGRGEVGVGPADRLEDAGDDRGDGRPEAADEPGAQRPRPEQAQGRAAPERRLRGRTRTSAARAVPQRQERLDVAAVLPPEGGLRGDPELEQEPELDLGRDERRELVQDRARADRPVEVEARGVEGLAADLRQRLDRDLDVGGVELALGRERDDDAPDVGAGGEPVGRLGLAGALERDERPAVGRAQEQVDARIRLAQQQMVRGLEPRGTARRCRERRTVRRRRRAVPPSVLTRDGISPGSPVVS